MKRGTGETTRQMLEARPNSIFIWPTSDLNYPRELKRFLKREDLILKTPSCLSSDSHWAGKRFGNIDIILDHSCWYHCHNGNFSKDWFSVLQLARTRVNRI